MAEDWNRTALLVIDMQKDFIEDWSSVALKGAKDIVPNVIRAVEVARQRGILVVWVVRENEPLGRDVELFRRHHYRAEKVGPATKGSEGAELVDGLVIKEGDYKLVKTRFSAFFATHLHLVLQGAGINSLVVTGVQTPNCIRQTVFDAVSLDYQPVTVIIDATAAATPDVHQGGIRRLHGEVEGVIVKAMGMFALYFKVRVLDSMQNAIMFNQHYPKVSLIGGVG
ncbi:inactive nicotinamidase [Spatholobus suberectus]|nr:inactive nicotinamidase [Spatholobus suberectus]